MTSFEELQNILRWSRENNAKIKIFFEKYPYVLALDKVIHAEDYEERNVSWIYAFGSKQPHQVLGSFSIKKIIIKKNNKILEVKSLQELVKRFIH
ncbi:MAG: hypothetical protein J7K23_00330 [Thermoproteales archaeon]|nr:hypothetical protein [Thermoproteales archaeon]